MIQLTDRDISIHNCRFQGYFDWINVNIKFPCNFIIEWTTINGKYSVQSQSYPRARSNIIKIDEKLTFNAELIFDKKKRQYLKKQSVINVNLTSKNRPDQVKLVGRITVDLSEVISLKKYSEISTHTLGYCSVESQISFSLKFLKSECLNKSVSDLDKSSFHDLYSIKVPIPSSNRTLNTTKSTPNISKSNIYVSEEEAPSIQHLVEDQNSCSKESLTYKDNQNIILINEKNIFKNKDQSPGKDSKSKQKKHSKQKSMKKLIFSNDEVSRGNLPIQQKFPKKGQKSQNTLESKSLHKPTKQQQDLKITIRQKQQKIRQLQEQIIRFNINQQNQQKLLYEKTLTIKKLQQQVKINENKVQDLNKAQNGFNQLKRQLGLIIKDKQQLNKDKQLLNRVNKQKDNEIERLKIENVQLENRVKEVNFNLNGQIVDLKQKIQNLQLSLKQKNMQIQFANKKAALIEQSLNHLRSLQLNEKINSNPNLLTQNRGQQQDEKKRNRILQSRLDSLLQSNHKLSEQIKENKNIVEILTKQNQLKVKQLQNQQKETKKYQQQNETLKNNIKTLQQTITQLQIQILKCRDPSYILPSLSIKSVVNVQENIKGNQGVQDLLQQIKKLQQTISYLAKQKSQLLVLNDSLKQNIRITQQKLKLLQNENQRLTQLLNEHKNNNNIVDVEPSQDSQNKHIHLNKKLQYYQEVQQKIDNPIITNVQLLTSDPVKAVLLAQLQLLRVQNAKITQELTKLKISIKQPVIKNQQNQSQSIQQDSIQSPIQITNFSQQLIQQSTKGFKKHHSIKDIYNQPQIKQYQKDQQRKEQQQKMKESQFIQDIQNIQQKKSPLLLQPKDLINPLSNIHQQKQQNPYQMQHNENNNSFTQHENLMIIDNGQDIKGTRVPVLKKNTQSVWDMESNFSARQFINEERQKSVKSILSKHTEFIDDNQFRIMSIDDQAEIQQLRIIIKDMKNKIKILTQTNLAYEKQLKSTQTEKIKLQQEYKSLLKQQQNSTNQLQKVWKQKQDLIYELMFGKHSSISKPSQQLVKKDDSNKEIKSYEQQPISISIKQTQKSSNTNSLQEQRNLRPERGRLFIDYGYLTQINEQTSMLQQTTLRLSNLEETFRNSEQNSNNELSLSLQKNIFRSELGNIKQKLTFLQQENIKYQRETKQLKQKLENKQRDLDDSLQKIKRLQEVNIINEERIKELINEKSKIDERRQQLEQIQKSLYNELGNKNTQTQRLNAQIQRLNSQTNKLKTQKQELRTQILELKTINEELRTQKQELKTINEELRTLNEELKAQNQGLKTQKQEMNERIEQLQMNVQISKIQQRSFCIQNRQNLQQSLHKIYLDLYSNLYQLTIVPIKINKQREVHIKRDKQREVSNKLIGLTNQLIIYPSVIKNNKQSLKYISSEQQLLPSLKVIQKRSNNIKDNNLNTNLVLKTRNNKQSLPQTQVQVQVSCPNKNKSCKQVVKDESQQSEYYSIDDEYERSVIQGMKKIQLQKQKIQLQRQKIQQQRQKKIQIQRQKNRQQGQNNMINVFMKKVKGLTPQKQHKQIDHRERDQNIEVMEIQIQQLQIQVREKHDLIRVLQQQLKINNISLRQLQEIKEIKEQLQHINKEKDKLIDQLQDTVYQLKRQLQAIQHKSTITIENNIITDQKYCINQIHLREQNHHLREQNHHLREQNHHLREQNQHLREQNQQLKISLSRMNEEFKRIQDKLQLAHYQIDRVKSQIGNIYHLNTQNTIRQKKQIKQQSNKQLVNSQKQAIDSQKSVIDSGKQLIDSNKEAIDSNKQAIDSIKQGIQQPRQSSTSHQLLIFSKGVKQNTNQQYQPIKRQHKTQNSSRQHQHINQQPQRIQKAHSLNNRSRSIIENKLKQTHHQNNQLRQQLISINRQLIKIKKQYQILQQSHQKLQQSYQKLQEQHQKLQQSSHQLQQLQELITKNKQNQIISNNINNIDSSSCSINHTKADFFQDLFIKDQQIQQLRMIIEQERQKFKQLSNLCLQIRAQSQLLIQQKQHQIKDYISQKNKEIERIQSKLNEQRTIKQNNSQELKIINKSLQNQLQTIKKQNQENINRNIQLQLQRKQMTLLKEQLINKQSLINKKIEQIQEYKKQQQKLNNQIIQLGSQINQLDNQIMQLSNKNKYNMQTEHKLNQIIQEQLQQINQLYKQLQINYNDMKANSQNINRITQINQQSQIKIKTLQTIMNQTYQSFKQIQTKYQQLQSIYYQSIKQIQRLTSIIEKSQKQDKTIERQNKSIQRQNRLIKNQNKTLLMQNLQLNQKIYKLSVLKDQLQANKKKKNSEQIRAYYKEVQQLKRQVQGLRKNQQQYLQEITKIKLQTSQFKKLHSQLSLPQSSIIMNNNNQLSNNDQKQKVQLKKQKVQLKKQKVQLKKEKVQLKKEKVQLKKEKVQLKKEKVQLNKEKKEEIMLLLSKISKLFRMINNKKYKSKNSSQDSNKEYNVIPLQSKDQHENKNKEYNVIPLQSKDQHNNKQNKQSKQSKQNKQSKQSKYQQRLSRQQELMKLISSVVSRNDMLQNQILMLKQQINNKQKLKSKKITETNKPINTFMNNTNNNMRQPHNIKTESINNNNSNDRKYQQSEISNLSRQLSKKSNDIKLTVIRNIDSIKQQCKQSIIKQLNQLTSIVQNILFIAK